MYSRTRITFTSTTRASWKRRAASGSRPISGIGPSWWRTMRTRSRGCWIEALVPSPILNVSWSQRTSMRPFGIFLLASLLYIALPAAAATKAIRFGKLWDGHSVIANAVVIVEDDKIRTVAAHAKIPPGAEVIDLRRYTGIPGMIDSHTHITYYWNGAPGTT